MNHEQLEKLLVPSGYSAEKTKFLVNGFKNGFSIKYTGPKKIQKQAPYLRLRVGNKVQLWNKVMKEVKAGHFAGPFKMPPFEHYIQSPIGLVNKDHGRDTRLIFHLSYPRDQSNSSVNVNTPTDECKVMHKDFDQAIALCLREIEQSQNPNQTIFIGKSDYESAFRNVGLNKESWPWLILKANSPLNGETYFFVDKCLPFGHSISCALFQEISGAIAFIVQVRISCRIINYLDDYLFVATLRSVCNSRIQVFLDICKQIGMLVSKEKTHWSEELMVFLGFLIDGRNHLVLIPIEKLDKANQMIDEIVRPKKNKITVRHLQQICGFFNFLYRCVVPGRAFTRPLYSFIPANLKPHHHLKIKPQMKMDLMMWRKFLAHPAVFCRPFADFNLNTNTAEDLDLYTDSSRNFSLGCSGIFEDEWFFIGWDEYTVLVKPSIEYLELFAVAVAVKLWAGKLKNRRVFLFCDNQAVCSMINTASSTCQELYGTHKSDHSGRFNSQCED